MKQVAIVDYGMGNIKSVHRALQYVGAKPFLCNDPDQLRQAKRVVLPGVGAFGDGMAGLQVTGMAEALLNFVATGRPLFGICLGMQLLFDHSEEHGKHQGLELIPGVVRKIPSKEDGHQLRKIPHIGWNTLKRPVESTDWYDGLLGRTSESDCFYFVHSFMALPASTDHLLAQCEYEGVTLTAAVRCDNVIGTQFHPEKSGELGLGILSQFLDM